MPCDVSMCRNSMFNMLEFAIEYRNRVSQCPQHNDMNLRKFELCHIPYFLGPSPSFSGFPVTFPPVPDHFCMFYDYFRCSVPLRCLPDCSVIRSFRFFRLSPCSVIRSFRFFRLSPSISLFRLISFQFSILGSDRSESGSLLPIRLHFCSATILFPVDLCVLLSFDHMTSISPSNYDPFLIVLFRI